MRQMMSLQSLHPVLVDFFSTHDLKKLVTYKQVVYTNKLHSEMWKALLLLLLVTLSVVAAEVTQALDIPTIGIGAGPECDGQVLVMHDMLGLNDDSPSFVKQYVNLGSLASQAARQFAEEVSNRKFPEERHCYR